MADRRELARITTYPELIGALRARADELNISRNSIDEISGLPSGYCGKLLGEGFTRILGRQSFQMVLDALGLQLVVIENPATTHYARRCSQRREQLNDHRVDHRNDPPAA